ncbi:CLUMA_CG017911, isoform A [Clunio marinus]|uniref:Eukaryotic translation initiation factor 3 subunit G n=1 Tax=Clunio marinus TaxID=568069 RepID=A0A1J1IYU2_9DIPT|nr:CLUMA_CG017911, isoform A [Clunio marinus]
MPEEYKSSWADEVELDSGTLPPPTEMVDSQGQKVITEYKFNKDDKKTKVVRTYKVTKHVVPKSIARRKKLPKFGDSAKDVDGPNAHTTFVSEDINMQLITNKEEEKTNDSVLDPKNQFAKCRFCNGGHFTTNCPYKHTASYIEKILDTKPTTSATATESSSSKPGKYVPPFIKDHQKNAGGKARDESTAIRISNLSESTSDADLEDLTSKFGKKSKMYLAKDKNTGLCKGFAYVHFYSKEDAATAIDTLDGFDYNHLILKAEWLQTLNIKKPLICIYELMYLTMSKNQFPKCRFCNGGHFTTNCPLYKHTTSHIEKILDTKPTTSATATESSSSKPGKYVPPFIKNHQKNAGGKARDESTAIRISNLSESTSDADLEDLTSKFGKKSKMYLAKDKNTGLCKGFAYVHFYSKEDAATAIDTLDGFDYNHLILKAEWSKPAP